MKVTITLTNHAPGYKDDPTTVIITGSCWVQVLPLLETIMFNATQEVYKLEGWNINIKWEQEEHQSPVS